MSKKRWKINPKLSAMENVFDAADVATRYFLSKRAHAFRLDEDELDELNAEIKTTAVLDFLRRVRQKKYNRKFTLFENIFSSTWSVCGNTLKKFSDSMKRRLNSTNIDRCIELPSGIQSPLGDTIPSRWSSLSYKNTRDIKVRANERERRRRKHAMSEECLKNYEQKERVLNMTQEYEDLLEDAEALGIRPVSREEFYAGY